MLSYDIDSLLDTPSFSFFDSFRNAPFRNLLTRFHLGHWDMVVILLLKCNM